MPTRSNDPPRLPPNPLGEGGPPPPSRRWGRKTVILGSGLLLLTLGSGALLANRLLAGAPQQTEEPTRPKTHGKQAGLEGKRGEHGDKPAANHAGKEQKSHGEENPNPSGASAPTAETAEAVAYLGQGPSKLGEFRIKLFDPVTRTVLRVSFRLEGVIACADETAFQSFLKSSLRFFREQIQVAVRSSDVPDFSDPQLRVLRRRMIARVNRAYNRDYLRSLEIKDLAVHESIDNAPYVRWQSPAANP